MSEFNSTFIMLANIYADGFDNRQTTEVYANGVMQVSIFVSVNYKGNSSGLEDDIKKYVQENVMIYGLTDDGNEEKVDWDSSTTSNGFPHDIEYSTGRSSSDKRAPLYFTVPPDSVGRHRWIAKLGEQETSTSTPVTITVRKFQPLADGSQFEFVKRVKAKNNNTLCAFRYKAGAFPDTQRLVKAYKYRGMKFPKTGGNSWLTIYNATATRYHPLSAIFLEYKENHLNFAEEQLYHPGEYESDVYHESNYMPIGQLPGPSLFSQSEIEDAWIDGVIIVISRSFKMNYEFMTGITAPISSFGSETCEFQDNFGNIVEIEFEWDENNYLKVKSAIVLYP